MNKTLIVGAAALAAVIASLVYLKDEPAERPAGASQSVPSESPRAKPAVAAQFSSQQSARDNSASQSAPADGKGAATDPRLAALAVSPDNGLIEFVVDASGKVIKEIDEDPGSPSFKKPLREYTYAGDQVIGLTAYRYAGDHVQVSRTAVSYKPDGSIDQYLEKTDFDFGKEPAKGSR